jgi:hypothetical protein
MTWQDRRSPARGLALVDVRGFGRQDRAAALCTLTLHCPQVPPPPQAEATNSLASASAPSSLPPTGASMVFSSLTGFSPACGDQFRERAPRMMNTSAAR